MAAWQIVAVAVAALQFASEARADWAYTHWGMTADQVIAASGGMAKLMPPDRRFRNDADHSEITVEGSFRDGPVTLSTGFTFDTGNGGLRCVLYNAKGDNVAPLRTLLLARFGKPVRQSEFSGAIDMTWRTPDAVELVVGPKPLAAAVTHCAPGSS